MSKNAKVSGSVVAGFPSPAEQYQETLGTRLRSACSLPHGSRTPARGGYAESIGPRSWQMKRSKLSKRASTRWDELMVVK